MRALLVLIFLTVPALAKPTIVVAPIEGDSDNQIANVIAEVAGEKATVIGPEKAAKAMSKLGLSTELERKDLTKLRARFDADLILSCKLAKESKRNTLEVGVTAKGRKTQNFTLTFKAADSDRFKSELREELAKRLEGGGEPDEVDDGDEDDDKAKKPKKKKKQRGGGDEGEEGENEGENEDEDQDGDEDEDNAKSRRHPVTQVALRVWAGASFGRRTLTYDSTATNKPPPVGTAAPAGRIEGEVYPAAFESIKGPAAGIGVFGKYERALGVKINVPAEPDDAVIAQSHYMIGVRYRLAFGSSTVAVGVAYAGRKYVADRSQLATPGQLDMPDVKYSAIAPGVIGRFAVTPTIGAFVGLDFLLMRSTGAIQKPEQYGAADVIAFEFAGGLDVAFGPNYGMHLAADFSQVGFKFKGNPGTMASARSVSAATDRTYSVLAAFAVTY